uniref:Retrovirus-related Pol polyprotein from transposon TNT 1-94 n=1 Tax=Tanacetum cinerariifolium TaxID=118510 RepID=A0A6L2K8J5_TANCI|nr:retrovirus-related Pol polyprotein from transposon TNT 1-94 [Tanacetum cinerariifolium]
MTTLADKAILSGADNRPPMLEKEMYDTWKSRIELYMLNRQHRRMILESVENGPLIWPLIKENGVTKPKKYSELSPTEAIQADCDIKVTNIILQGQPPKVYALKGDDPIDSINHMMSFLTAVGTSRYPTTNNQLRNSSNPRKQATINNGRITLQPIQERQTSLATDPGIIEVKATQTVITHNASYQANDLDAYDSDCDEINTTKVALMANLSHYGSYDLAELHNHDNANHNVINQTVQAMTCSKQLNTMNHSETGIISDSNIISYSQYVSESQQAVVQNSNSPAQQDVLILSVIEQLKTQVVNCTNINMDNKSVNDTLTAELERNKEHVRVLTEGQNVDLKSKDNISDSCAQSVEIDNLKQTLSEHLKEKKAQQLEPKLYDGNVIEKTNAIVICDSEETLMLAEESRSKMILKQKDHKMSEKKVNTTPVDYNSMNYLEPTASSRPTKVEVPKELPKVSMVNTSLKKLKHHLASFDVVVKERTTATTIIEGTWRFEHTKACFRDEIFPFVKALKDLFNSFDQFLVDEPFEVQNVFHQMEQTVEQHRSQEKDIVIIKLNERIKSLSGNMKEDKIKKELEEIETINIELDHRVTKLIAENEHLKRTYKHTQEETATLREIGEQGRSLNPLNSSLDYACCLNCLWYLDSGCSKHMAGDRSQLTNFVNKFLDTVKFDNDHVVKIMGYGDHQIGNVNISRVYFVEGLRHNLFSVGQFCDSDLEVAFCQHTCFICNLEGIDLLTESQGKNLYTLSLGDMMSSSLICLLSKASKIKSWLWHRLLSYLNFGAINHLARQGLVRGLPKLKFEKDHMCSACAMGKSKKKSHKPKSEDTNQEKLYLLHMDLYGPMRVESVGISHETSVARSPQQNGVVERHNRMLIKAAHTMLIYAQALLFLWAEAVTTACYTQNRSIVRLRHGKAPYDLLHNKLPNLSFFHVLGALCYPTNDSLNLGKLQPKADIGPALHELTPTTISLGLVPNSHSSTPFIPPSRTDWDILFQPLFNKLLTPPPSFDHPTPKVIVPILEVVTPEPAASTGSPSSTTIIQDAPSPSNSQSTPETQPLVIPDNVEEDN